MRALSPTSGCSASFPICADSDRSVRLAWSERRWRCREVQCSSKTWTEESAVAPARLLLTARAGLEVTRQVNELARR